MRFLSSSLSSSYCFDSVHSGLGLFSVCLQSSSEEESGDDGDDGDDGEVGEVGEEEGMQGVPVTVAMVKSWVDSITKVIRLP